MTVKEIYEKNKSCSYIHDIFISRNINDEGAESYTLDLVLCEFPNYDKSSLLSIRFRGVFDIKIDKIDGLYKVILSINDISENQIEGAKFRVIDISGNNISFLCHSFEIEVPRSQS